MDAGKRRRGAPRQETGAGPRIVRSTLHVGAGEVAQGPPRAERRGTPCPQRGPCLEQVASRHPRSAATRPWRMARLLGHAEGSERHVFPLDGRGLPAGAGGGGSDRQGSHHRNRGGRSESAKRRPGRDYQGQRGGEVRLLATSRRPALEATPNGVQEAGHQAGALHHGGKERLRRRIGRIPVEDQGGRLQAVRDTRHPYRLHG